MGAISGIDTKPGIRVLGVLGTPSLGRGTCPGEALVQGANVYTFTINRGLRSVVNVHAYIHIIQQCNVTLKTYKFWRFLYERRRRAAMLATDHCALLLVFRSFSRRLILDVARLIVTKLYNMIDSDPDFRIRSEIWSPSKNWRPS